ncbi:FYN-binding protein 1-like [Seriola lalandi dorsalis]|uniref:FYN-binding protein 1-like n=1 Tax=Seriola lalandi dorsalis TaxID=1841481 RepID=UPI000C6F95ED|nr:FYN-binding protein 1-like [Seriola lalandi dorsalis]
MFAHKDQERQSHTCGLMALRRSAMPDATSRLALKEKVCAESTVKSRIAVLMGDLSGAAIITHSSHTHKPDFEGSLLKTQKPKPIRTQIKLERQSSDPCVPKMMLPPVLVLGSPPQKPERPPNVDIHRFRRNRKALNDGPRMKIPHHVAPSPTPGPLHLKPPPNLAAILMQQSERFKKHQKRNREGDTNHGEVTEEKQAEPKGTINSEEMKRRAKKEEKKQLKQQEAKEQRHKHTMMVVKMKGPAPVVKRGKAHLDFKRAKSDFPLDKGRIIQNTEDYVRTESIDKVYPHKEEEGPGSMSYQYESEVYDDIGAPAYRVSLLPQLTTDRDDLYVDVDSQSPPLSFNGLDIYDNFNEDSIYEIN